MFIKTVLQVISKYLTNVNKDIERVSFENDYVEE